MSFWRTDDPVMDDNGNVVMGGMWHHQREWWKLTNHIKLLVGGYASGKTMIGAKRIIAAALRNASANGFVPSMAVSPSFKQAKRTTIPTILALLDGRKIKYRYNKSDHEIRIAYKGLRNIIWIGSGDDPDSLKGPNIGTVWLDEPFIMDRAVLTQSMARLRHPDAKLVELILSGTPESLNWGFDISEGDEKENFDVGLVRASTKSNKALKGNYYDTQKSAYGDDEKMVEAFLEGKFVNMNRGVIYYGFKRDEHIVDLPDPGGALCAGMDFNVNPMAACVFWVRDNHMHYIDEVELPNSDTEEMCNELKRRYGNRLRVIYPDPTGKAGHASAPAGRSDFAVIQQKGFVIKARRPGLPTRRDRYNATNARFKGGWLTMSSKCKKLPRYFEQLAHETINKQEDMTHLTTAATYAVEHIFPLVRESAGRQTRMGGV